jgi:hypothetical protein
MKDFEFILTSYEDCDYFVTEIWYQYNMLAIVKEDNAEIQLFDENRNKDILESDLFKKAIDIAKRKLSNK